MLFGMNGWLLGFVLFTSELLRLIGFPFADTADWNSTSQLPSCSCAGSMFVENTKSPSNGRQSSVAIQLV